MTDPYDDFLRCDAEEAYKESLYPVCSNCGEPIMTEKCYKIGKRFYCEDCMENDFSAYVDDYKKGA